MSLIPRRQFLTSSAVVGSTVAIGALGAVEAAAQSGSEPDKREYYELRNYRLATAGQQKRVLAYLESAAIPAWERAGIGPVGVFTETGKMASPDVHLLLTFTSPEEFLNERVRLEEDSAYCKAAAAYLETAADDPAFKRIDSSLLVAFTGQSQLRLPKRKPRVLELRTYESYCEAKARRKVEMFNEGEISIFRQVGFETVFFGESLVGPELPNLKYMLATDDLEASKAGWEAFLKSREFVAMKDNPRYADTVSQIHSLFLVPTAFSEV